MGYSGQGTDYGRSLHSAVVFDMDDDGTCCVRAGWRVRMRLVAGVPGSMSGVAVSMGPARVRLDTQVLMGRVESAALIRSSEATWQE
jgi:hypothetical protein